MVKKATKEKDKLYFYLWKDVFDGRSLYIYPTMTLPGNV